MSKMQESNGIKEKFFTKKNILFVISLVLIVIVFVLFDQITKILAIRYLTGKGEVPFLGDLLVFNLVYNKGAAWGMGGDNLFTRILLVIISWLVAVGIIGYFIYLVIKRKELNTKPMSEEEAILQMEMLGHDFFIYKDSETSKVCVLYKRKDNNYGLIETN